MYFLSTIGDNIATAMSSNNLWTAIAKTLIVILLGFFLTKKKIFPENTGKILTKIVMTVSIPCLAFTSFMSDFSTSAGIDALVNIIFGFVIYIVFIFVGKLIFIWVKEPNKKLTLAILFAFGSTTFFGQPIISAVYTAQAYNDSNMLNIAYRVFLYSYAYVAMSGLKIKKAGDESGEGMPLNEVLKKIFLNPIIIATLVGLTLWVLQAIPGLNAVPKTIYGQTGDGKVAFFRIDVTLPWIFQVMKLLASLASPLVWLAIGCTLGKSSLKEAAEDKYAWIYSALKAFAAPLIVLLILFIIELVARLTGNHLISIQTVQSSVIMWLVPPATVAVSYAISFDKEKEMASHISLISTLVSIIGVIVWILLLTIIESTGFFVDFSLLGGIA